MTALVSLRLPQTSTLSQLLARDPETRLASSASASASAKQMADGQKVAKVARWAVVETQHAIRVLVGVGNKGDDIQTTEPIGMLKAAQR